MIKYDEYGNPYEDENEQELNIPQTEMGVRPISPYNPVVSTPLQSETQFETTYDTPDQYYQPDVRGQQEPGVAPIVKATPTYMPQNTQLTEEQKQWLGGADPQDPYILSRMPGPKVGVDYFTNPEDQDIAMRLGFGRGEPTQQPGMPTMPQQPVMPQQPGMAQPGMRPPSQGEIVGGVTTVPTPEVISRPLPTTSTTGQERRYPTFTPNKFGFNQDQLAQDVIKRETGNNPQYMTGYHYEPDQNGKRKSTAFGMYGINEPTYRDIQKTDPYFANKPLSSLTPEDQTRAFNVLTDKMGDRLTQLGVKPEYGTLSAAMFLGADGLANYLKTGQISEAAMKANGGYDATKKIVDERLRSTQQPTPNPVFTEPLEPSKRQEPKVVEVLRRGDDGSLYSFISDKSSDPVDRRIASSELKDRIETQQNIEAATQRVSELEKDPNKTTDLARDLAKDRGEGSWLRAIVLSGLGFGRQANLEFEKLGVGPKTYGSTQIDGRSFTTVTTESGRLLRAYDDEGRIVDNKTFAKLQAEATAGKAATKPEVGSVYEQRDSNGNIISKGRLVTEFKNNKPQTYIDLGNGKKATFDQSWSPESISTSAAKANIGLYTDLAKKHGTNVLEAEKEFVRINGPFKSDAARQDFRSNYGLYSGVPLAPGATATGATAQGPTTGAPVAPVAPGTSVTTPIGQMQQTEKQREGLNDYITKTVMPETTDAAARSSIRREQIALFDNPNINLEKVFGWMSNLRKSDSNADRITGDIILGKAVGDKEFDNFKQMINMTDFNEYEKNAILQYGIRNREIAGKSRLDVVGPGVVTESDMKILGEAALDVRKATPLTAYTMMYGSKFDSDLTTYKGDWIAENQDKFANPAQMNAAWRKEANGFKQAYLNTSKQRADYLIKFGGPNPSAELVRRAYKLFPAPSYDAANGWSLK